MSNVIYTIGYGNQKPKEFIDRLVSAKIDVILDVRRKYSRSWCSAYNIARIERILGPIEYHHVNSLGNYYDTLEAYNSWLTSDYATGRRLKHIAGAIGGNDFNYCLMCSERDPRACHRTCIACALVKELGDGWEVVHL